MNLTAIQTRRLEPPQDDLFAVLDEVLPELHEQDVLVIASKAVAIHEGRSVLEKDAETKKRLIGKESDFIIPTTTPNSWDLTVKNNMVTFAGGIDESNAGEYLLLLPKDPTASAWSIREYLLKKYELTELGVIITDSTALPYRQGVVALSIGHAGFEPIKDQVGTLDLFGRPFTYTYINVVDSIAVAAAFVMGETNESTPLCLVRDIPHITFSNEDKSASLLIQPELDVFYPLLKGTYKNN